MYKILIVKTSSLGDLLQTFPVIETLKAHFKDGLIDWVVEKEGALLAGFHPFIHQTHIIQTKSWRKNLFSKQTRKEWDCFKDKLDAVEYDIVFDLQGNFKSSLITWLANAKRKVGFGRKTVPEAINLLVTNERYDPPPGRNRREDYLYLLEKSLGIAPKQLKKLILHEVEPPQVSPILIAPGSAWKSKQLPLKTLMEFLSFLKQEERAPFIYAWGTFEEKEAVEMLQKTFGGTVLEKLSLPELQGTMAHCRLVIASDSLPLHLAATAGVPTFSWFGPSSAEVYRPLGDQNRSIQGKCPLNVSFEKRCPYLRTCEGFCTQSISSEELITGFSGIKKN